MVAPETVEDQVVPGVPSGVQPKSVAAQVRKALHTKRTKWYPQAKWRPAEVGGGEQTRKKENKKKSGSSHDRRTKWYPWAKCRLGEFCVDLPEFADQKGANVQVLTKKKKENSPAPPRWYRGMWGSEGRRCKQLRADGLLKGEGLTETVLSNVSGMVVSQPR